MDKDTMKHKMTIKSASKQYSALPSTASQNTSSTCTKFQSGFSPGLGGKSCFSRPSARLGEYESERSQGDVSQGRDNRESHICDQLQYPMVMQLQFASILADFQKKIHREAGFS